MQQAEETSGATGQGAVNSSNPILNDFKRNALRIFLLMIQYLKYNNLPFL